MTILRTSVVLVGLSWLGLPPVEAQSPAPRQAFQSCSHCHGTPDPRVAGDRLWIERIGTTACVQPPAPRAKKQREALIALLTGPGLPRPLVESTSRAMGPGEGSVTLPGGRGSVLLVATRPDGHPREHGAVRLVWKAGGQEPRVLPAGHYRVQGYRFHATDPDGVRWQLWGSGAKGRRIEIRPGENQALSLDRSVHVNATARRARGKLFLGLGVTGDSGLGVTVIRDADRVPARFTILARGEQLAQGALQYG